ncbi:glycosyltransferase family 1 protein [Sorangium sp. So ce426]|uniref:glycosyltransferase family 1 protein n=1 Tax=Sorangium sp. So ce426 TaxID=3133312 RepID=UPI003F5AF271
MSPKRRPDVVCFSHLRWSFVFQRPQHLLSRCARTRRVFFFEEPVWSDGPPRIEAAPVDRHGVRVVTPHLPSGLDDARIHALQRDLVDDMLARFGIDDHVLWYYTPMALLFSRHLAASAVVYDCMDELSAFAGAPPALKHHEAELLRRADVVFTGGRSLYESKRALHANVHLLPSSVDIAHFAAARRLLAQPADQATIPGPRLGYFGVIDERMDLDLIAGVAAARPGWHLVFVGPVVKIDPASLPRAPNIHYLGKKTYEELPAYLAGWDVALLPFARNEATRFISPTKTPEYLAGGKPVVSTSIRDVVRPYGELGLARIADTAGDFVAAVEAYLAEDHAARLARADALLAQGSWDATWSKIDKLLDGLLMAARRPAARQGADV